METSQWFMQALVSHFLSTSVVATLQLLLAGATVPISSQILPYAEDISCCPPPLPPWPLLAHTAQPLVFPASISTPFSHILSSGGQEPQHNAKSERSRSTHHSSLYMLALLGLGLLRFATQELLTFAFVSESKDGTQASCYSNASCSSSLEWERFHFLTFTAGHNLVLTASLTLTCPVLQNTNPLGTLQNLL